MRNKKDAVLEQSLTSEDTVVPTLGQPTCANPKHSGSFVPDDSGVQVGIFRSWTS